MPRAATIIALLILLLVFPYVSSAGAVWRLEISDYQEPSATRWLLGQIGIWRPPIGTTFTINSSAYASSPYQTDNTPCLTAAGTNVRPGVVASNFLPLGTIIAINDQHYIVEDRLHSRYQGRFIDIWFPSTAEALAFGRQRLEATIVGYGTPGQTLNTRPGQRGVQKPTVIERASLRFIAFTRIISRTIGTNVNQYDVDCFKQ